MERRKEKCQRLNDECKPYRMLKEAGDKVPRQIHNIVKEGIFWRTKFVEDREIEKGGPLSYIYKTLGWYPKEGMEDNFELKYTRTLYYNAIVNGVQVKLSSFRSNALRNVKGRCKGECFGLTRCFPW